MLLPARFFLLGWQATSTNIRNRPAMNRAAETDGLIGGCTGGVKGRHPINAGAVDWFRV